MAVFNEPTKWAQTLGKDADVTTIPNTAGDTDPSIDKIFPSVFSIPLAQGGRAIPRSVLNGFFRLLGDWVFYIQNGGLASYSTIYDYAVGSVVKYNRELYRCIQANGASTTLKAPTDLAYWSKITTLADVANAFANQDLSNLSVVGLSKFANPSFSNIDDTARIAIASNSAISLKYDNLTLGATATEYTAPANGYFALNKVASGNQNIHWHIMNGGAEICANRIDYTNGAQACFVTPLMKKGQVMRLTYSVDGTTNYFRFIYAVGSESER